MGNIITIEQLKNQYYITNSDNYKLPYQFFGINAKNLISDHRNNIYNKITYIADQYNLIIRILNNIKEITGLKLNQINYIVIDNTLDEYKKDRDRKASTIVLFLTNDSTKDIIVFRKNYTFK